MSGYTHGMPVWQQIPVTSVPRAQAFYAALFNFKFRTTEADAEAASDRKDFIAHFTYPDATLGEKLQIGGGIMKIREGERIVDTVYKAENGGQTGVAPLAYYYVDDLDKAVGKAEEMGGKVLVGRTAEGETGEYVVVQDTEGNAVGLYSCVKK